jgi:hypothetical protein
MDMGFAVTSSLTRHRRAHIRFLFIAPIFAPRFFQAPPGGECESPLRFAVTSPPSGCEEDFILKVSDMLGTQEKATTCVVDFCLS